VSGCTGVEHAAAGHHAVPVAVRLEVFERGVGDRVLLHERREVRDHGEAGVLDAGHARPYIRHAVAASCVEQRIQLRTDERHVHDTEHAAVLIDGGGEACDDRHTTATHHARDISLRQRA